MQSLHIKETEKTPSFIYDVEDFTISISGVSNIDSPEFYQRITDHVDFIQQTNPIRLNLNIRLTEICNQSKRGLLFFLVKLKSLQVDGNCDINIAWNYPKGNKLIRTIGENLEYMVMIPIHVKAEVPEPQEAEMAY